jgi:predicted acyl esterase
MPATCRPASLKLYRRIVEIGIIIERDVAVTLRDGVGFYIDPFRRADGQPVPPLIAWGPYGKHGHTRYTVNFPNCGVKPDELSPLATFEAPDPTYWVPRGYAIINPDLKGTWYSNGDATFLS